MAKMLCLLIEVAFLVGPSVAVLNERNYYAEQGILSVPVTSVVSLQFIFMENVQRGVGHLEWSLQAKCFLLCWNFQHGKWMSLVPC